MGMQAIGAIVTSRYSVRLFNTKSERFPLIIGLLGVAIASPLVLLINNTGMIAFGMFLFLIRGFFSGLCGTPIQTLSVISFKKDNMISVNSVFSISRQLSISMGVAISSILISLGYQHQDIYNFYAPINSGARQYF